MSVIRKKQEEKNLKILRELLSFESNRYCFDCNQRGPTYVNITIGSFVCTNCSGALRKYSHRLKSISMSNFNQTEMDFIKKRGNNICKKIYYGLCEHNIPPEMDIKNGMLDSHLRAKYELKKWYLDPVTELEEETMVQNQAIFDRVERGVAKPVKSYSANSSSNIIIEPPKQPSSAKLASTKASRTSIDLADNHLSSVNSMSQQKSSITITNTIDPSKLAGGSAVKLPMASDTNTTSWLSNTDEKFNQNTQSPFGDDFLFSTANDKSSNFTPISKSQTMNFSMPPLVPMPQQGATSDNASHVPMNHGQLKDSDKYAALAELDDLFSSSSVSKVCTAVPAQSVFAPAWDGMSPANNYPWYGASNQYNVAPHITASTLTSNPFATPQYQPPPPSSLSSLSSSSANTAATFNPFTTSSNGEHQHASVHWPLAPVLANPFLNSAATTVNSKNPFL